jgi:hypothetical protein
MIDQDNGFISRKSITTFNDLSPELILSIFDYLSVADRYKSFFNYDTRLSQLVKRWASYSRKGLDADILRFSTLHSWYKILLHDGGKIFYIYPQQGQQTRNCMSSPSNSSDLHWWFIWNVDKLMFTDERIAEIVQRHSFRLTPFFFHEVRNDRSNSNSNDKTPVCRTFYGGHIIAMPRGMEYLKPWLTTNYPEHADRILNENNDYRNIDEACAPVFEAEWIRLTKIIRNAAYAMWEELRKLEDVNPLDIRSTSW